MTRIIAAVFVFGTALFAQTIGSITGVISAPDGNGVPGATVSAVRMFSPTPLTTPVVATTSANAQGSYRFDGLQAPASYRICVTPGDTVLLDPCAWSDQPPLWNLSRGETATVNIPLVAGQFIHVRVADPNGNMSKQEQDPQNGKRSAVTVWTQTAAGHGQMFRDMGLANGARYLRLAVPIGQDIGLTASSSLNVVDEQGNSAKAGSAATTTTAAASANGGSNNSGAKSQAPITVHSGPQETVVRLIAK